MPSKIVFSRKLSPALRVQAMRLQEPVCQMCGIASAEIDQTTGRTSILRISQRNDLHLSGLADASLWIACNICAEGRKSAGLSEHPEVLAHVPKGYVRTYVN